MFLYTLLVHQGDTNILPPPLEQMIDIRPKIPLVIKEILPDIFPILARKALWWLGPEQQVHTLLEEGLN